MSVLFRYAKPLGHTPMTHEDERRYYVCWFRIDSADQYVVWFTNHTEGVLVDENGQSARFATSKGALSWARENSIPIVSEQPILHDFDAVIEWLDNTAQKAPPYEELLGVWNLTDDVSMSVGRAEECDLTNEQERLYHMLFASTTAGDVIGAPGPPPEGWPSDDLARLRHFIEHRVALFRSALGPLRG